MTMKRQILITGVGGQGIVLLGRLIAESAIHKGLPVIASETHGMAQRGGVVFAHVKIGGFLSPLIKPDSADLLISLKEETLAPFMHYLSTEGVALCNSGINPNDRRVICIDADRIAKEGGAPKAVNIAMLGFACSNSVRQGSLLLPFDASDVETVIIQRFKDNEALLDKTLKIFNTARSL